MCNVLGRCDFFLWIWPQQEFIHHFSLLLPRSKPSSKPSHQATVCSSFLVSSHVLRFQRWHPGVQISGVCLRPETHETPVTSPSEIKLKCDTVEGKHITCNTCWILLRLEKRFMITCNTFCGLRQRKHLFSYSLCHALWRRRSCTQPTEDLPATVTARVNFCFSAQPPSVILQPPLTLPFNTHKHTQLSITHPCIQLHLQIYIYSITYRAHWAEFQRAIEIGTSSQKSERTRMQASTKAM